MNSERKNKSLPKSLEDHLAKLREHYQNNNILSCLMSAREMKSSKGDASDHTVPSRRHKHRSDKVGMCAEEFNTALQCSLTDILRWNK